ncbi:MAG: DUF5658 family protein [Ktedonobacterales bacterium]
MISSASRGKGRNADLYATRPLWTPQSMPARMRSAARRSDSYSSERSRKASEGGRWLPELLALFAVLNIGDIVSTYIGLAGGMREGNPLMSTLLAHYGFGALIMYKALVIVAVAVGIYVLRAFHTSIATITIWICNALVLGVVVMNVVQYLALR